MFKYLSVNAQFKVKMKCLLCDKDSAIGNDALGDCILDFLDRIKVHYISFKTKLDRSELIIEELQVKNVDLLETIEQLRDDLKRATPDNRKRQKTSSFEDDGIGLLPNIAAVLPDKSTDDLNEAFDNEDWDDTFFAPPTQEEQAKGKELEPTAFPQPMIFKCEEKKTANSTPPKVLSPINQNIVLKRSPRDRVLPRRKPTPNKPKAARDQENSNASKWISKEKISNSPGLLKKYLSTPTMLDAAQPIEIVDDSPNNQQENKGCKIRNFHQTKLNFSKNLPIKIPEHLSETFCEDLVAASPTSVNILSNRKPSRTKVDNSLFLCPRKKESSSSAEVSEESIGSSPSKTRIKSEPITVKKYPKAILDIEHSPAKKSCLEPLDKDDSSVFILPSQTNDVVCIEETGETSSSVDLLNDMILQEDRLADLLRELETTSPKNDIKGNKEKMEKTSEEFKTPTKFPKLPTFGCSDCETYFKFIGKNLSAEEMEKRLRNCCKHKKPVTLHHTPEGFWDPHFHSFASDDPRNETLIDTRFIDKK